MATDYGILQLATRDETVTIQQNESTKGLPVPTVEKLPRLITYLQGIWQTNRDGRQDVSDQMIRNLRAFRNKYDPEKATAIRAEGSPDVYMGLTRTKCRHGISWLMDIFTSAEKPWTLEPSPLPEPSAMAQGKVMQIIAQVMKDKVQAAANEAPAVTPELIAQVAATMQPMAEEFIDLEMKERARKMDRLVHDQLLEGGFFREFRKFIRDLVILKGGILKGPIPRQVTSFKWEPDPKRDGKWRRASAKETKPFWLAVSPFDVYPDPTSDSPEAPLVERFKIERSELSALRYQPGYFEETIKKIMEDFEKYSTNADGEESLDTTRAELEEKDEGSRSSVLGDKAVCREFTLNVPGCELVDYNDQKVLKKLPGAPKKIEEDKCYPMDIILVGNEIIFMKFVEDPLERVGYYKYGWDEVNGSYWYEGVPETMEDLQRMCNASARSLARNMAIASGPMAEVDVDRLLPGEELEAIKPLRMFQTVSKGNGQSPAIRFFQPDMNAEGLLRVYDAFAKLADEYTGIPAYSYGNDRVAGAGRTSSGLSMLMTAAARGIKAVILGIDENVIKPLVQAQVDWNMKYYPDDRVKGDLRVVSTGAVAIMVREQMTERRMEFLQATNNPVDLQLTGLEGRANILREAARALELSSTTVVKSPEDVRELVSSEEAKGQQLQQQQEQMLMAEQQAQMAKLQADIQAQQAKLESERGKLQLEAARLQLERERLQIDTQLKAAQMQSDDRRSQLDIGLKAAQAASAAQKAESDSRLAGLDASMRLADHMTNQSMLEDDMFGAEDEEPGEEEEMTEGEETPVEEPANAGE